MKTLAHTFKTWALALMLHPFIFMIYLVFLDSLQIEFAIGGIFFIFLLSLFASIPSLFIAWLLFYIVSNGEFSLGEKLIAWFASVIVAILLNFIFLALAIDGVIDGDLMKILPPSLMAAVLAILIRLRSFFEFQSNYKS